MQNSMDRLGYLDGAIGEASTNIKETDAIRLHALLYYVACTNVVGCMHYYIRMRVLVCQVVFSILD